MFTASGTKKIVVQFCILTILASYGYIFVFAKNNLPNGQGRALTEKVEAGPAGYTFENLLSAGCNFQKDIAPTVPDMTELLYIKVLRICKEVGQQGLRPQISSISTGIHLSNSYHYLGCAVDFAGRDPNFVNGKIGQALILAAKKQGFTFEAPFNRLNPGADLNQTYHIHLDLGTNCPNSKPLERPILNLD